MTDHRAGILIVDPQIRWLQQHSNILAFLADVPPSHQMRISGEDLLANPDLMLRKITDWLGLRSGPKVIDGMKHPERWPFASVGPRNARFGNDPNFCKQPGLRAGRRKLESLDDALPWRADRVGIKPEVRRLAERFGYD
jgi:hypothetical protein